MRERGALYRYAAVAYALAVTIVGLSVNPLALVLLVPLAFARPLLRELNLLRDVDEREMMIAYRSSHIAFYVMLMLLAVLLTSKAVLKGIGIPAEWYLLLIIPVFVKFATSTALNYSLRKAGLSIAWLFGALWTGFAFLSHGLSLTGLLESLIGLSILACAAIGTRWRYVGGPLLVIEGGAAIVFVLSASWPPVMKLLMSLILGFPLILAGLFIFTSKAEQN